jgi:carbon starvation protein CstA
MMFVSIACGAVSGFHATQSPMMARCMTNERYGRPCFYGAMIAEGVVALIWAAAASSFFGSVGGLQEYVASLPATANKAAEVVNLISNSWLGSVGGVLAVLGVVAAPITSGDTAFRCARLIAADFLRIKQDKIIKRLLLCAPLFAISVVLMFVDFQILWRYFAWFNQSLSVLTLWAITVWLAKNRKFFYVTLIPALWMTMVCTTYILVAPEGFQLSAMSGNMLGGAITFTTLVLFVRWKARMK